MSIPHIPFLEMVKTADHKQVLVFVDQKHVGTFKLHPNPRFVLRVLFDVRKGEPGVRVGHVYSKRDMRILAHTHFLNDATT